MRLGPPRGFGWFAGGTSLVEAILVLALVTLIAAIVSDARRCALAALAPLVGRGPDRTATGAVDVIFWSWAVLHRVLAVTITIAFHRRRLSTARRDSSWNPLQPDIPPPPFDRRLPHAPRLSIAFLLTWMATTAFVLFLFNLCGMAQVKLAVNGRLLLPASPPSSAGCWPGSNPSRSGGSAATARREFSVLDRRRSALHRSERDYVSQPATGDLTARVDTAWALSIEEGNSTGSAAVRLTVAQVDDFKRTLAAQPPAPALRTDSVSKLAAVTAAAPELLRLRSTGLGHRSAGGVSHGGRPSDLCNTQLSQ